MSVHWLDQQLLSSARRLMATDPALLSPTGRRLVETARRNSATADPVITRRHLRLVHSDASRARTSMSERDSAP